MNKRIAFAFAGAALLASAVFAARNPMAGGQEMFATKNIIQNA